MIPTVAYQGISGAFGEEACRAFLPDHDPLPHPSFRSVVDALIHDEADLAMLPVENAYAGPVPGVEELVRSSGVEICGSHWLPIRIQLMALPEARLEDLESVRSHPMALAQCVRRLRSLGLVTEPAENTAVAASNLAQSGDRRCGVAGSDAAATAYGLTILVPDIHDRADNRTRFLVLARKSG